MPPFFDEKLPKKPYFLVSLRSIRGENSVDLEKLSGVLRRLSREGFLPVFVSMQDSFDLEISRRAARLTDGISVQIKDAEELYFLLEKGFPLQKKILLKQGFLSLTMGRFTQSGTAELPRTRSLCDLFRRII